MPESKVLTQRHVDDPDSHCNKLPALVADIRLVTARSDVVIICQIDIEAELFRKGLEG